MRPRIAALAIATALAGPAQAASDVVAQRGPVALTSDDVAQLLGSLDPAARDKIQHDPAALATLVRERLVQAMLLQEARDKKWDQKPDVALAANQAHDAVVATSYLASVSAADPGYPSDEEVQAAYDANKARLMIPRQYALAQIFIAVPPGTARQVEDEAKKKLADLRAQAVKPKADFALLAKQASQDRATADKGGALGWLREDEMAPEIRAAVAGLPEGGVSDPVRTADGWHLLRLAGTKPAAPAALADVKAKLAEALRTQRVQQNAQAYVAGELRSQPVQIDEIALGKLSAR